MTESLPRTSLEWQGFAVASQAPPSLVAEVAGIARIAAGWQVELSGRGERDWGGLARQLLSLSASPDAYLLTQGDAGRGHFRAAMLENGIMTGALLVAEAPLAVARDWLVARLGTQLDADERFRLLDGRPGGAMTPRGPIVCFCCHVGSNAIAEAVAAGCADVKSVGIATRAGINCGRCKPEIERIIASGAAS